MALKHIVYVPGNLDLDYLATIHPPPSNYKPNIEKIYAFIDLLPRTRVSQEKMRFEFGDYSYIHSAKLKELFGDESKKMIDWLIQSGVIKSDNRYIVKKKPKGYKLTDLYLNARPIEKEINKLTLIRKLRRVSKFQKRTQTNQESLFKFFSGLCIDKEKASQASWEYYRKTDHEYPGLLDEYYRNTKEGDIGTKSHPKPTDPMIRHYYDLTQINKIAQREYTFIQDTTANRLHTNLTSIRSDQRNFLTYKGESLVSIDYVNSQPLISCALLNPMFYINRDAEEVTGGETFNALMNYDMMSNYESELFTCIDVSSNIYNTIYDDIYNTISMLPSIMFPETSTSLVNTNQESFKSLCEKGVLYEYIEQHALSLGISNKLTRQQVKAAVFQMMFTSNNFIGQKGAESKRIFKELFPVEYEIFASIKRKDKTNLPILLQKTESKLMFERVVPRIQMELPNAPIFTIHDSIVTTIGNEDYVAMVMQQELSKALGLNGKTDIKYWSEFNSMNHKIVA
jgi:hypothetical protein